MKNQKQISLIVLDWYDNEARSLPWRIEPHHSKTGVLADPYKVWLSEIMLQQTTVKAVIPYYEKFVARWPNINSLSLASDQDVMEAWAGLGYYTRARNLVKCARVIVSQYNSVFPTDEKSLLALPGIGPYTASAIRSIAFDKKATVIDGNINRFILRFYAILTPISKSKKIIKSLAEGLTPQNRSGDYAQALMDIGSTICIAKCPRCQKCPIKAKCLSHKKDITQKIPCPENKQIKPTRYGYAYIIFSKEESFLLVRRPNHGLLGGMLGYPTSDWTIKKPTSFNPPLETNWTIHKETIKHTFSHFNLELKLVSGFSDYVPKGYLKKHFKTYNKLLLPSLMRKIFEFMIKTGSKN